MNSPDDWIEVGSIDLTHRPFCARASGSEFSPPQPDGDIGDTPGVVAAPVALAAVMVLGVARFFVTLSTDADVFGVGITVIVGSMLVLSSSVIAGWIVPGGGFAGIYGVESGRAAPLVGGPLGVELHTVVDGLPSRDTGDMVPGVLPTIDVGMVPNAIPDIIVVDGVIAAVLSATDVKTATIDGVGRGVAAMGGGDGAGITSVGGTGMVDPGTSIKMLPVSRTATTAPCR